MKCLIRPIAIADRDFLPEILYQALYVPPGHLPFPKNIVQSPELAKYIDNWTSGKDLGFIAAIAESNIPVGAAWLTLFTKENPGYGYIDEHTPELTIAVLPAYRDRGFGTQLLTKLLKLAESYYSSVSLSVSTNSPALKLYRRFEFETVKQNKKSLTMIKMIKNIEIA